MNVGVSLINVGLPGRLDRLGGYSNQNAVHICMKLYKLHTCISCTYPTKAIQSHHRPTWISWLRRHPEKQQVPAANIQTPLPQGHPWKAQTSPRWATGTLRSLFPSFSGPAGAEHRFLLTPSVVCFQLWFACILLQKATD